VPVDLYIDGQAASMGAYLSMGARKVYMSKYSRMMLHEGRMSEGGTAEELRDMADEADACNALLVDMVCQKTSMTEAQVREKFFNGKDNWFNADEAVALKLCDGIYDLDEGASALVSVEMMAQYNDNGLFKNSNINVMPEFKLTKEAMTALGLKDGASEAEINMAVVAHAQKLSTATLEVQAVKATAVKENVTAQLKEALEAKKITVELQAVMAVQYSEKPDELKQVLAVMPGFVSVNDALNLQDRADGSAMVFKPAAVALMKEGWDVLDRSDRLKNLKAADENAFLALYETKFGCKPNSRAVPQDVQKEYAKWMASQRK
jgi:ClpP class serine protease